MENAERYTSTIRVRLSASDAHYGGQLVNGAYMLSLFGDVATELAILCDGDEGLLVGYENIEFLAPLYPGDFVEVTGRITKIGRTSDRKSTPLNSSHANISYAVFCLKKKKIR